MKTLAGAAAALLVVLVAATPAVRFALGHGLTLLATGQLAQFRQYLQSLGRWAPLLSIGLMVAEAVAIPVPVTILLVANGLVFGVWRGAIVSIAGGCAGAMAAYAIGRWVGRRLLERVVPASSFRWADALMTRYGNRAIVLGRWVPGVPGDPISYVAGLTRVPALSFLALTMIGLVPANLAAAYLGSRIGTDVPLRYWVSGLLLAATICLGWVFARRRRRSAALDVPAHHS
jgi:uncharacterized membrane protein YdjX (TVP38/TMEM64 family)